MKQSSHPLTGIKNIEDFLSSYDPNSTHLECGEDGENLPLILNRDEKISFIDHVLKNEKYDLLSREQKGMVREYLQMTTGYSRAQVARAIKTHREKVQEKEPKLIDTNSFEAGQIIGRMPPRLRAAVAAVGCLLILIAGNSMKGYNEDLTFLTGQVPNTFEVSGDTRILLPDSDSLEARIDTFETVTMNASGETIAAPLFSQKRELWPDGYHKIAVKNTFVTEKEKLISRREERLEERRKKLWNQILVQDTNQTHASAPSEAGQTVIVNQTTVAGTPVDIWSFLGQGEEGEVLIIRDGVPSWGTPMTPGVGNPEMGAGRMPQGAENSGAPEQGSRRGYGGSGGSSSSSTTTTTTTTITQTVGDSDWTVDGTNVYSALANNVGIGIAAPSTKLEIGGTASGLVFHAQDLLTTSGGLIVEEGQTVRFNAVSYLFPYTDGAASGKILATDGAGQLSWITDAGGTFSSGNVLTIFGSEGDARYVNIAGDTMTGDLVLQSADLTASGVTITANLAASGTLSVEGATSLLGAVTFGGAYTFPVADGNANKVLKTNGVGVLSWQDDETVGTGLSETSGDRRYVEQAGDTMTGALIIGNGAGLTASGDIITKSAFSGATLRINGYTDLWGNLAVSGTTVFDGAATFGSTVSLNGVTYTFPYSDGAASGKVLTTDGAGQLSWATDQNTGTTYVAGEGLTLDGSVFYLSDSFSGSSLEVSGTASGWVLHGQDGISSSGGLMVAGVMSGSELNVMAGGDSYILGNVGIGQTAPGVALDVVGTISGGALTVMATSDSYIMGNLGIGTTSPDTELSIIGAMSGSNLRVDNNADIWGTLSVSGATVFDGVATFGSTVSLNGVTYTFPYSDGASSGKVLTTDGAGQLSWATDQNTGTSYVAGEGLTLAGSVFSLSNSLSGTALQIIGAISGSNLRVDNNADIWGTLSVSGATVFDGASTLGSTLNVTSNIAGSGTLSVDGLTYLNNNTAITGVLSATSNISGSGSLSIEGTTSLQGALTIGGAYTLPVADGDSGYILKTNGGGTVTWAVDATAGSGLGQGEADQRYVQIGGDTMTGNLVLQGKNLTATGVIVTQNLTVSGALSMEGNLSQNADNALHYFGAANDASIKYDGTNFVFNPKEVGSGYMEVIGTMSGAAINIMAGADSYIMGNVGIGQTSPGVALDVVGTISGTTISVQGAYTLPTVDGDNGQVLKSNGAGVLTWSADSTGEGMAQADGDARYVLISGDTMTGNLVLQGKNLTATGVNVTSNLAASGTLSVDGLAYLNGGGIVTGTLGVSSNLSASGTLSVEGKISSSGALTVDGNILTRGNLVINDDLGGTNAVLTFGNDAGLETLTFNDTSNEFDLSDDLNITGIMRASGNIAGSGTLSIEGVSSLQGAVTFGSTVTLNGVTYTFPYSDGAASGKVLTTDGAGQLSWATDQNSSTSYVAGEGLTLAGTVFSLSDSFSGSSLKVSGTASGWVLHGQDGISSSGSLMVAGVMSGSELNVMAGGDNYILGNIGIGHNSPNTALDVLGTMSGKALTIMGGTNSYFLGNVGIGQTSPGVALEVSGTSSGFYLHASENISASGTLSIDGLAYLNGSSVITGALDTTGNITTDGNLTINEDNGAANAVLTFGNDAGLETLTFNDTSNEFDLSDDLNITGIMRASGNIAGSGTLSIEGASSLQGAVTFGSTVTLNGVTYTFPYSDGAASGKVLTTDGAGQLSWATDQNSGTSYVAGEGLTLAGSVFSLSDSFSGSSLKVSGTASGWVLHGQDGISSSGSLMVAGVMSGSELNVMAGDDSYILGNLGIGQTAPGVALDVVGTISGSALTVMSGNSYLLGNVGIGQTSPDAALDVLGTMSGMSLNISTFSTASTGAIYLGMSGNGTGILINSEATTQPGIAIDMHLGNAQAAPHLMLGYDGVFDTNLYRSGVDVLTTDDQFLIRTTNAVNQESILIDTEETTGTQNVFRIISDVAGAEDNAFRIQANGATFSDGAYSGAGADYAEWFYSGGQNLRPGELVCIDLSRDESVKRCENEADSNLIGIISTNPAFVGNTIGGADGLPVPGYSLVGLIGQVPTKVIVEEGTPIRPGDALTASAIPGIARKARAGEPTVGVALQGRNMTGKGKINVLISRRNSSVTVDVVEEHVLETIAAMEIEDEVKFMVSDAIENIGVDKLKNMISSFSGSNLLPESRFEEVLEVKNNKETKTVLSALASVFVQNSLRVRETAYFEDSIEVANKVTTSELHVSQITSNGTIFLSDNLEISGRVIAYDAEIKNNLAVGGILSASTVDMSSGSTIKGNVNIEGELLINGKPISASSLNINPDEKLEVADIIAQDSLFVMGYVTIKGLAKFLGDVEVKGELIVSNNQAGVAVIPEAGDKVTVAFNPRFKSTPVVTASSDSFATWRIAFRSQTGFILELKAEATEKIEFTWNALAVKDLSISEGKRSDGVTYIDFPVDNKGIPVSENEIWNGCIRRQVSLDSEGKPYNCSRYHEDNIWTHPDITIEFTYDPERNPPLVLPEGYRLVTVDYQIEKSEDEEESDDSNTVVDTGSGDTVDNDSGSGEIKTPLPSSTGSTITDPPASSGSTTSSTGSTVTDPPNTSTGSTVTDPPTSSGSTITDPTKTSSGSTTEPKPEDTPATDEPKTETGSTTPPSESQEETKQETGSGATS
ncbi:hypothetical protein KJ652_06805 [Patescibacteria group bacterium]|nr:hypothetical protein [Patescibacteria group bacterium]MBU1124259.1 hypothetical protein [Patescibacteria group bacterium]